MWYWWTMFFCNLIYPVIMIIGGWMMWKHCPAKVNSFIGYRTPRSKKSLEAWRFAHADCGRRWWRFGWGMLPLSVLAQLPFYGRSDEAIDRMAFWGGVISGAVLLLTTFPTERALRKNFDEAGRPRDKT